MTKINQENFERELLKFLKKSESDIPFTISKYDKRYLGQTLSDITPRSPSSYSQDPSVTFAYTNAIPEKQAAMIVASFGLEVANQYSDLGFTENNFNVESYRLLRLTLDRFGEPQKNADLHQELVLGILDSPLVSEALEPDTRLYLAEQLSSPIIAHEISEEVRSSQFADLKNKILAAKDDYDKIYDEFSRTSLFKDSINDWNRALREVRELPMGVLQNIQDQVENSVDVKIEHTVWDNIYDLTITGYSDFEMSFKPVREAFKVESGIRFEFYHDKDIPDTSLRITKDKIEFVSDKVPEIKLDMSDLTLPNEHDISK